SGRRRMYRLFPCLLMSRMPSTWPALQHRPHACSATDLLAQIIAESVSGGHLWGTRTVSLLAAGAFVWTGTRFPIASAALWRTHVVRGSLRPRHSAVASAQVWPRESAVRTATDSS